MIFCLCCYATLGVLCVVQRNNTVKAACGLTSTACCFTQERPAGKRDLKRNGRTKQGKRNIRNNVLRAAQRARVHVHTQRLHISTQWRVESQRHSSHTQHTAQRNPTAHTLKARWDTRLCAAVRHARARGQGTREQTSVTRTCTAEEGKGGGS